MSNYPSDVSQASHSRAHDEHDADRTVYPVKPVDDSAFVVLRCSVDDAKELKKIETRVLVPERP